MLGPTQTTVRFVTERTNESAMEKFIRSEMMHRVVKMIVMGMIAQNFMYTQSKEMEVILE